MKYVIPLTVLVLSGCSTAVHIRDGSQDAFVGDGRTKDTCEVSVSDANTAQVTYTSKRCAIFITPKE